MINGIKMSGFRFRTGLSQASASTFATTVNFKVSIKRMMEETAVAGRNGPSASGTEQLSTMQSWVLSYMSLSPHMQAVSKPQEEPSMLDAMHVT